MICRERLSDPAPAESHRRGKEGRDRWCRPPRLRGQAPEMSATAVRWRSWRHTRRALRRATIELSGTRQTPDNWTIRKSRGGTRLPEIGASWGPLREVTVNRGFQRGCEGLTFQKASPECKRRRAGGSVSVEKREGLLELSTHIRFLDLSGPGHYFCRSLPERDFSFPSIKV